MQIKQQVLEFLKANPNATNKEIAAACSTTYGTAAKYRSELRGEGEFDKFDPLSRRADKPATDYAKAQPEEIKPETTAERLELHRDKARIKSLTEQNKRLIKDYDELMGKYDEALVITERKSAESYSVDLETNPDSDAVVMLQWSDWHLEERIEKSTTRGMNEYNPDIAKARAIKLVENTLKVIKKERQDVKINEIFLCLGGDFVNNFLHDHDIPMNYLSPIEAVMFAKTILSSAIKTLAENAGVESIEIMAIRGNHGRITKKMSSSTDYKMNYEAIIYNTLKEEFKDDLFNWHIPESELGYINIWDKTIRSFHGHQVNYMGGVGGLTIPLNKKIAKWDETEKADWNLMHHYHTLSMPGRTTSLNGSLCGWNSYALSCGFAYEPPMQSFQLLDKKRGFTVRMPIFCE